jgi:hypothetical protein
VKFGTKRYIDISLNILNEVLFDMDWHWILRREMMLELFKL